MITINMTTCKDGREHTRQHECVDATEARMWLRRWVESLEGSRKYKLEKYMEGCKAINFAMAFGWTDPNDDSDFCVFTSKESSAEEWERIARQRAKEKEELKERLEDLEAERVQAVENKKAPVWFMNVKDFNAFLRVWSDYQTKRIPDMGGEKRAMDEVRAFLNQMQVYGYLKVLEEGELPF